jgi:hypothetical protein
MKKSKILVVALIGLLMAGGLFLAGCDKGGCPNGSCEIDYTRGIKDTCGEYTCKVDFNQVNSSNCNYKENCCAR